MYHAICTDLDGTLLNRDHQLDPYTIDTVRRLAADGIPIIIATGRHHADVAGIRDVLGIRPYLITSNGARVHAPDDTPLYASDIAPAVVRELVRPELVGEHGRVIVNLFTDTGWLIDREAPHLLEFHQDSGFVYRVADLPAYPAEDVAKVLYIGEPADLAVLAERLASRFRRCALRDLLAAGLPGGDDRGRLEGTRAAGGAGAARSRSRALRRVRRQHERYRPAGNGRPSVHDG